MSFFKEVVIYFPVEIWGLEYKIGLHLRPILRPQIKTYSHKILGEILFEKNRFSFETYSPQNFQLYKNRS